MVVFLLGTALAGLSGRAAADTSGASGGGGSVSVGVSTGGGTPGQGGSGSSGSGTGGPTSGSVGWTCTSTYLTLNNDGGFPAGGPLPGAWYSVTCVDSASGSQVTQTVWLTDGQPAPTPAVDPRTLALQAENAIRLPAPGIGLDPAGTAVVQLATWLWVDPAIWHDFAVTASVGDVSATAVARPESVEWSTGDGSTTTCPGPGTPYDVDLPSNDQSTGCSHVFSRTSAGEPSPLGTPDDGSFTVTATVVWSVSWTSTGVAGGGELPTLFTTSSTPLRVAQVESVGTEAGTGAPLGSSVLGATA